MTATPVKRVRDAKDMECVICGTVVPKVPHYRQTTFKCCSRKCTAAYQAKKNGREKQCVVCGATFFVTTTRVESAKYCSNLCKGRALTGRGRTEFKCQHCHKTIYAPKSTNRKFCSRACINKASKAVWRPTFTAARANLKRTGKLTHCNRCGYSAEPRILGVHHIDRDHTNNVPENLEVLCPNCHSLEHKRHVSHGGNRHKH